MQDRYGVSVLFDFIILDKLKPLEEELIRVKNHAENVWMPIIDRFLKNRVR